MEGSVQEAQITELLSRLVVSLGEEKVNKLIEKAQGNQKQVFFKVKEKKRTKKQIFK